MTRRKLRLAGYTDLHRRPPFYRGRRPTKLGCINLIFGFMFLVLSVVLIIKYLSEPNPVGESIVAFGGVLVIAVLFLLSAILIITGIILLTPRRKGKDKHLIKELDQEIEQWPSR